MIEYQNYLENQYQKILAKVLGDESINIFKDLDNKEFMHRRLNEIFQKTYNAERENFIKNLIQENNQLKEQIKSMGGVVPTSPKTPIFTAPILPIRSDDIEKTNLIRENQQFKIKLIRLQKDFENDRESFRRQITGLQEAKKTLELRQSNQIQEWKQKEAKLLESFKQFIEENKNLQTEIVQLNGRIDGQKLRHAVSFTDNDNFRKKVKQLQVQNREMILTLNNNLNQIKSLSASNSKLNKDYSFLQHKYKLLEQQKQQLQNEINSLNQVREQELNQNFKLLEIECEAKGTIVKKLQSVITSLNKELSEKCEQLMIWKQNYENSLKQNNIEKLRLKYEFQILELRNQLIASQQQYQKQLQRRSERANNIIKEEVVTMQGNKHKEKAEYSNKISSLSKEKYQLEEEIRAFKKKLDEMQSRNRSIKMDLEKQIDRINIQNQTMKSSISSKQAQYKLQVKSLQEHIFSLKKSISQQADKINELQLLLVISRRQGKEFRDGFDRQTQKMKDTQVHIMRKDLAIKEIEKQLQVKQVRIRQIMSSLNMESQEKNQLQMRLVEQKNINQGLGLQINKLKVTLLKGQSNLNNVEVKYRTQIKQLVEKHQQEIENMKCQITLKVHQQIRSLQQLSITQKQKAEIASKYQKIELQRLYSENTNLRETHAHDIIQIKQLSDSLKEVHNQIGYIRDQESTRSASVQEQILVLKQENQSVLKSLLVSKSQNNQYRTKLSQFKNQMNIVIKGILKMFWQEILNIREEMIVFQSQQKHKIQSYSIQMSERVKQYANLVNNKIKQAFAIDCNDLRQKYTRDVSMNKEQWQQKCRKLELDLMAMEAQRQMQRAEVSKKMKIKQSQIQNQHYNIDQLLRKNQELQQLCGKYPAIIKKLQEKNRQMSQLVNIHKYEQIKIKSSYQIQKQRAKKVQNEYEAKLQTYKSKYIQDNEDLFNRYQKSLQDMITKTSIETNFQDTITFKTPSRKHTSISNLRHQISQQRIRLKQLSKQ